MWNPFKKNSNQHTTKVTVLVKSGEKWIKVNDVVKQLNSQLEVMKNETDMPSIHVKVILRHLIGEYSSLLTDPK